MSFVLIVALLVAVITLGVVAYTQGKTIKNYEKELIKKARKGKK
jgi:hypothetical protein